ncbi:MAG: PEGA domain-containing protein [Phycisphaeraceae bacterium]|nr:PEGA domain-containing protein [Phycisphaeraceae bacterium]
MSGFGSHGLCLALLGSLLTVAGGLGGCVRRTITITSEPSGALVHLNDQEVGRTPLTIGFTHYGVYDVRLTHEGRWVGRDVALGEFGVSETELQELVDAGQVHQRGDGEEQTEYLLRYHPLWVEASTSTPVWDIIGLDLIAEVTPGRKHSRQAWHFTLPRAGPEDEELLIDRAEQMRALLLQTLPDPAGHAQAREAVREPAPGEVERETED